MNLQQGIEQAIAASGVAARFNRVGSMFTLFFTGRDVTDFESAKTSDTQRFNSFFHAMLESGVYFPPSQFETAFLSAVHTQDDIDRTITAVRRALAG
jgi:glutamate-1-semialdehyde 2,1-aminomutase